MRLLVVEDCKTNRLALTELFRECDAVELILARNLQEATGLLDDCDFMVLDLSLPDSDPESSIKWMKASGIPCIVFSATWTNEIITQAAQAGAYNFLTKSNSADQIMAAVHFALAKEQLLFECREQRIKACKELSERTYIKLKRGACGDHPNGHEKEAS